MSFENYKNVYGLKLNFIHFIKINVKPHLYIDRYKKFF